MKEKGEEELGLSTNDALHRLEKDIEHILQQYELSRSNRKSKSWLRDALHHSSPHTTLNWLSIATIILVIALLSLTASMHEREHFSLICQVVFIALLLALGLIVELHDNKLRHDEIPQRVHALIEHVHDARNRIHWSSAHYPQLLLPYSPCITLQWTYRDGELVNLPWALLVKDDVIVIRPGQVSPGYCESLEKNAEYPLLHAKEVYGPPLQNANEFFCTPKLRHPLEYKRYRMLETPYVNHVKIALEQVWDRSITQHKRQRHYLMVKVVGWSVLPLCAAVSLIVGVAKYVLLREDGDDGVEWFVVQPIGVVVPLLPLVFPVAWNLLNYFGMARFQTLFESSASFHREEMVFDEQESAQMSAPDLKHQRRRVLSNFLHIVNGDCAMMTRSANIVHVLGSLTALCCVDKKGILSWPNPTAEKIFFLRNDNTSSKSSSMTNVDLSTDVDSLKENDSMGPNDPLPAVGEVLDLTHDYNDPFKLHFDDTGWKRFLNNLKPLGLGILLNTCHVETQEHYTQFCSHITCEAMYNENLIPVSNRRCLCELAKEIGFVDEARKIFRLEKKLCAYRHLQNEIARRDNKYARALHTKLKFPFPHMFAVVVKELSSGAMQLLAQGTADIVLDSCMDYWNGHDLCPLTIGDRKKIQDFYQRTSLTAYCTAFAYKPLAKSVNEKLGKLYLELPSDSRHLCLTTNSPVLCGCRGIAESHIKSTLSHFYSADSLLCNDSPILLLSDVDNCFDTQCNQVFIGMVTMQYQVQLDMVHLIEQLERACIRFVHFSKENELRSRVFNEKMGLESGWNCHISLLSDKTRRESGPSECWANHGTARVCSPASLPRRRRAPAEGRPSFTSIRCKNVEKHTVLK